MHGPVGSGEATRAGAAVIAHTSLDAVMAASIPARRGAREARAFTRCVENSAAILPLLSGCRPILRPMARGPKGEQRAADVIGASVMGAKIATGEIARKGGRARAAKLSPERRSEIARRAAAGDGRNGRSRKGTAGLRLIAALAGTTYSAGKNRGNYP